MWAWLAALAYERRMETTATNSRFPWVSTAMAVATLVVWAASLGGLAAADQEFPIFPLAIAGYVAYLITVGAWLLPRPRPGRLDDVLRAAGGRGHLVVSSAVVLVAAAVVFATGAALTGLDTGFVVPVLTPWVNELRQVHLWPGVGGVELFILASYVLVPGALLLALRARPRQLGLCPPAAGTTLASLACVVPSLAFVVWALASSQLSAAGLGLLMVHNFVSNGFCEEFLCRGMILSHLRAALSTDWALLVQALIFALMHFHPTGLDEQARPLRSAAEDIALNMPIGLAFGFLAVRSQSIALPTLLHCFRWVPS
jgi:membrane protease YdiL (CAAX protease family)